MDDFEDIRGDNQCDEVPCEETFYDAVSKNEEAGGVSDMISIKLSDDANK